MKMKIRAEAKDIVIFIIYSIFLLYVVAVGVINVNSFAMDATFKGLNPFPAFGKDLLGATIIFYILALIASIFSASTKFFDIEKGFGLTTDPKVEKGYTRWMTEKEMRKAYSVKEITLKSESYEYAGVPLINNGKKAWVDNGENHSLIVGASGSGKTQCIMHSLIKILGKKGESMIVTDPKGELYEESANFLKTKGYKVIILNFRDPSKGSRWNPLHLPYILYKEAGNDPSKEMLRDKSQELLEDLAMNILRDPNNKDNPFWESSASNYFSGLAMALFEDAPESQININSIYLMDSLGDTRLGASNYMKEYFKFKGDMSPASVSASGIVNAPSDTKGGIVSTFKDKIKVFASREGISEMLSQSDFDLRDIGREKTALFVKIHDEKTTYHALATVLVKQIYESLIDTAHENQGLKLKYRTNFILDEFANMPALKDVESMITASRSRNIRFVFAIQNFAQLNKTYGKEVAETIKGNCGNMVFLITTELSALEEISKLCGDVKPKKSKENMPAEPIRPLVTVSDLQQFKQFEVLINRFRNNPFKTKFTPNFKIDWGISKELSQYPERTIGKVDVFDIKKFVDDKRKEQGLDNMPFPGGGGGFGGFNPFAGMGGGGPMPSNPFASPMGEKPISDPMANSINGGKLNIDDLVKKLDQKIAELEAEEEAEKKKEEEKQVEKIESEIIPSEEKKKEESKEDETIEKPKINVDADSIIVDDNVQDDNFFDDFFGGDE